MNILITEKEFQEYRKLKQEKEELIKVNETNKELANLYLKYEPIITKAKWEVNKILNNKNAEVHAFNHKHVNNKTKQLLLLTTEMLVIQDEINKLKESDK